MKKVYVAGLLLTVASLTGCTIKGPTIPEISTGDAQSVLGTELTGTELTGIESTGVVDASSVIREAITGSIDSGVVPMVTGSKAVVEKSGVMAEVDTLINELHTQETDETKLTEPDISFLEKIIQKVKDLGK